MNNYKPTLIERYIFSPDPVRQRPISSISPTIRFVDYLSLELYSEQSNNYEYIFETFYFSLYKKPFDKWKNKSTQPQTFSLSRLPVLKTLASSYPNQLESVFEELSISD